MGYLITMINARKTIHRLYEEMLRELYGPAVFTTMIPEAVDFVEAIAQRKPVAQFKPKGAAAKAIKALAAEVEARIADADTRGINPSAGGRVSHGQDGRPPPPRRRERRRIHGRRARAGTAPPASPTARPRPTSRASSAARTSRGSPWTGSPPTPASPARTSTGKASTASPRASRLRGQLQPIRVRWDAEQGLYVIVCGERRWRAARVAGLPSVAAVIVEGPLDASELLAIQLVENALREDLKPVEQAKAYRQLMDRNGWSTRQVSRELNIAQPQVVRALALLNLPADVQEQVEQGTLAPATAYEIGKLDDPDAQRAWPAASSTRRLTRQEAVEAVRRRKDGRAEPARPAAAAEFRVSDAVTVTVKYRKADTLTPVQALRLALKQALALEKEAGQGGDSREPGGRGHAA